MADRYEEALVHKAMCMLVAIEDGYGENLPDPVQVLLSEAIAMLQYVDKGASTRSAGSDPNGTYLKKG